jgi:hypothetical protein
MTVCETLTITCLAAVRAGHHSEGVPTEGVPTKISRAGLAAELAHITTAELGNHTYGVCLRHR